MDVAAWLRGLGLEQYEQAFRENAIDAEVLPELSEADLEKLGMLLGHRKRFRRAIVALGPSTNHPDPSTDETIVQTTRAAEPIAERRQLTVMFVDLVGSTALASRLDPEDLREIIGAYHRCVADTIARLGGYVAKYMGDGVLVYFGYPQAHENDAELAVRAGLALSETVERLRRAEPLRVRIGIATGQVVVGDLITSGEGQERGVVGETPNLAARLQALAEPDAVVIGPQTRQLLGDLFEYRDLGAVEAKGFPELINAYQVVGESAVESRFEALHGATPTPLVGREEEVDLLQRQWHRAKSGEGRVVLLSGEPGIGKSRLTVALQERIENEPHTRLRYFCSPHHQDSALHPTIAQLGRAAGFERDDTPERKLDKLASLLAQSSPEDGALLAELLSLPTEGRFPPLQLAPQRKKEKTFEALLGQLEHLARQGPVLMLYEDVHWIDPSSRELLDLVIERVPRLPVLLLVTFRPEFQPQWIGQAHVTVLVLNRLDRREGAALVQRVVGTGELPSDVVAEIIERTDGVPLFVEELTKAVLEGGNASIVLSGAAATASNVPATLHASLVARLDWLGSAAKEVAQVGATIGREFSYELLAAVAQQNVAELDAALDKLVTAGLAFRRGTPPHATFLFKHALIQDAAYGTLLRGRRRELHTQIAAALQEHLPDSSAVRPELLAHHLTEAGLSGEAVKFWSAAGGNALARAANREACAFFERAIALLGDQEESPATLAAIVDLRRQLHQAIYPLGDLQRGRANMLQAEVAAERLADPIRLSLVLSSQCYLLAATGELPAAIEASERALSCLASRDDLDAAVNARLMLARSLYAAGRYAEAIRRALMAVVDLLGEDLARSAQHGLNPTVNVRVWLTLCHAELGEFETGAVEGTVAVRLAAHPSCGEHESVWSRVGLGRLQVVSGAFASAIETLEPALTLCEDQWEIYFSRVASSLGSAYVGIGRIDEGLGLLEEADSRAQKIGFTFGHALVLAQLGAAFLLAGKPDLAHDAGHRAVEAAQRWGERGNEAWARCLLGNVALAQGHWQEAETRYHDALAIAAPLAMAPVQAQCSEGLKHLAQAQSA